MYGSASGSSGSALLLLLSAEAEGPAEEGPAAEEAEEVDWEADADWGVAFWGVAWGSMTRSWTITGGSMGRRSAAHVVSPCEGG